MQGLNIRFSIFRPINSPDDTYGGSVIVYTQIFSFLKGNLQANLLKEDIVAQNPGLRTDRIHRMTMRRGSLAIKENDVVRIDFPSWSPYLGKYFRVLKVSTSNFIPSDPRDYMILTLSVSEESHIETYVPDIIPTVSYSSGEIGDVGQYILEILFSGAVSATNFSLGVTVKINGVAVGIVSGTRQDPLTSLVYYELDTPVDINDEVTFEYSSGAGVIRDESGTEIDSISAQTIINYVGSHFYFDTEESSMWIPII